MTSQHNHTTDDTVGAMHDTAAALEDAEAVLHRSAEAAQRQDTTDRLHRLGRDVSAEARDIERRATGLSNRAGPAR